jgi:hypothetical protein
MATYGSGTYGTGLYGGLAGDTVVSGVRATATATGRVGTVSIKPHVATAARATATSRARPGIVSGISPYDPPPPFVPGPPQYPSVVLRWAPGSKPSQAIQTWVDITSRCREWQWQYGRNDELDTPEPGRGYVLLDNRDRVFDPSNTGGTWYGNIKPRKMFEMQYSYGGTAYPGFIAYARGFPQEWPANGADATVRVDLVDALSVLNGTDLIVGFSRPEEDTGSRIAAVLDTVGIPDALRDIDTGTVMTAAFDVTDSGVSALSHAQRVTADEDGQLFAAKDGKVTFHNRHRRLNAASLHTFSDAPSASLRYTPALQAPFDDTYLWSSIYVSGPNSTDTAGTATDSSSFADYLQLVRTISSTLPTEPERTALAQYHLNRYKQPALRAAQIEMKGASNPTSLWPVLLDLEISDQITIQRFATGGTIMTLVQNIEGIGHAARPGGPWVTTVQTSPADTNSYWVLESATRGSIDSVNLLAP